MTIRIAFAIISLALAGAPAWAQASTQASPAATPAPLADLVQVELQTEKGRILLALDRGRAPLTTANFLRYVDAGRFDGITFYRAMPYGSGNGLIQGGITKDSRLLYPPVAHEPASKTGIAHEAGTILLANAGPGTARSDFFITLGSIPFDDDFAPFGKVVEGMDVVKAIFASPTSPTKGVGAMKGQMLEPGIVIRSAKRVPASTAN
ncbi:peptidylprolyl isomerase [Sphingomonas swuensis]|uniref:Peptidyl-prolyl cis-trans isomerase n=1 Tax=Sphingomonas swuensis TaxID=977800 RepID=A0ABP7TCZ4_9SPHN